MCNSSMQFRYVILLYLGKFLKENINWDIKMKIISYMNNDAMDTSMLQYCNFGYVILLVIRGASCAAMWLFLFLSFTI